MSDMVKHYWDLCGGVVTTGNWNDLTSGSTGDFDQGAWKEIVSPSAGGKIVLFDVLVQWKASGNASLLAVKCNPYIVGNYFLNRQISVVYDTSVPADDRIDGWLENVIYPFHHPMTVPVVSNTGYGIEVFYTPDAAGGSEAEQPALFLQYGIIPATTGRVI